jgi:hypothetical protein
MLTVNSFPCSTKTRNEVMETRIGAKDQRSWNKIEFRRALIIHFISLARASDTRSIQRFSHAKNLMNLILFARRSVGAGGVQRLTYRANKFVQNSHPFVTRSHHALLNANAPLRNVAIQRPPKGQYYESSKCRPPKQPMETFRICEESGSAAYWYRKRLAIMSSNGP